MHRSIRWIALVAVAAVAGVLVAAASSADDSIGVTGVILPTSQSVTTRDAGGNIRIEGSGTHAWTGSLTGTSTVQTHFVIHASGLVTYQGFITFTGTTPCGAGTIRLEASGSGPFPGPMEGHARTVDDGDATVPLHASLDTELFLTPSGAALTYTGDVRCESSSWGGRSL